MSNPDPMTRAAEALERIGEALARIAEALERSTATPVVPRVGQTWRVGPDPYYNSPDPYYNNGRLRTRVAEGDEVEIVRSADPDGDYEVVRTDGALVYIARECLVERV